MSSSSKKSIASLRTQRLLELPAILQRLENAAACELGRARVRLVAPAGDAREVRRRLSGTTQARRFLAADRAAPFGGITDIAPQLKRAVIGSLLDPSDLTAIERFAAGARRLKAAMEQAEQAENSVLHASAELIVPRADLEKAIRDAIDEAAGEVKDDASMELLRARKAIRQTQNSIQAKLRSMLGDSSVQSHLQDAFVTVRDGRYCLPVKAESRNAVPGIVHDRSGSGGAFFIEPQAVVDLNNRLRELVADEREAVRQILKQLTEYVAGVETDLRAALESCGELDFLFAKARLSLAMEASEPEVAASEPNKSCGWNLKQARHPLIEQPIPNDIWLGDGGETPNGSTPDFDVMLITGPNTGGKTVVLKTLGLLTLMAACGLHVPAHSGSRVCLAGQVFADIGDEQSIEQSLSTFSSHMTQVIGVLRHAQAGDLVLLDEVGAGTDPDEGAALAKAVLRNLQRRGVRVVATTHYGELKQFALGAERFVNASVEFDNESLRPTYHLRIGVPGASNAIDIAARLGLPKELAGRARRYLGRERAEAEIATQKLEETQRELSQQTESTRRRHEEIEQLRAEYEVRLQKLQNEVDAARREAKREAHELVQQAQAEADSVLRDLRRAGRESKQTEDARERLRTLQKRVEPVKDRKSVEPPASKPVPVSKPEPPTPNPEPPTIGDAVKVRSLNKEGVLLTAPNGTGRVEVRIGAMKVKVPTADVIKAETPKPQKVRGVAAIQTRKSVTIEDEINLIGKTTNEAVMELEKYLDDAVLADAEQVRIVHGKGSGALRRTIHHWLKNHRAVTEYSLADPGEGGEGATVVQLG